MALRGSCLAALGGLALLVGSTAPVAAQPLGTFRWQLAPFCNVVTLSVQQVLSAFILVGADDQCGAAPAAIVGTAVLRPGGAAQFGLTIIGAAGVPAHAEATVDPVTLLGTWQDGEGHTGDFLPNPTLPTAGGPLPAPVAAGGALGTGIVTTSLLAPSAVTTDKVAAGAVTTPALAPGAVTTDKLAPGAVTTPTLAAGAVTTDKLAPGAVDGTRLAAGAVGAAQINPGEIQRRIDGTCPAGQFAQGVGADGSVACAGALPANGVGAGLVAARIIGLPSQSGLPENRFGAISGSSGQSVVSGNVTMVSPAIPVVARDLSVRFTSAPLGGNRTVTLIVDGVPSQLACQASGDQAACTDTGHVVLIPGGSGLVLQVHSENGVLFTVPATDAEVSWRAVMP